MSQKVIIPDALAAIAAGRAHIKTSEFAHVTNHAPQTVRKNFCLTGECLGVRPIKAGHILMWPVDATAVLLNGGQ
jgi:hypothetical protein